YVVHTYSGYENKVKANLEKTVENRNIHDLIKDVQVPVEETVEIKNGKKRAVQRKTYPGYVLVKMVMNDDSWYVVRNTRGVTGFVGPGSKPVPLSEAEVRSMGISQPLTTIDVTVGENVKVVSGPFENFVALVKEINNEKKKVKAYVNMFGRDTLVEFDFEQVQKIE
ncbi:MAG TPA: transcription termination/antitermination protein NusG, partial [Clostridiaceae bacterium]|nr:transcription termination/antitermination protein NusG [Clostridiaceae bacterium]